MQISEITEGWGNVLKNVAWQATGLHNFRSDPNTSGIRTYTNQFCENLVHKIDIGLTNGTISSDPSASIDTGPNTWYRVAPGHMITGKPIKLVLRITKTGSDFIQTTTGDWFTHETPPKVWLRNSDGARMLDTALKTARQASTTARNTTARNTGSDTSMPSLNEAASPNFSISSFCDSYLQKYLGASYNQYKTELEGYTAEIQKTYTDKKAIKAMTMLAKFIYTTIYKHKA
jgi:hypothetical protein